MSEVIDQMVRAADRALDPSRHRVAREVKDLASFAAHLVALQYVIKLENRKALLAAGQIIAADAAEQIGHYQPRVGDYPEWTPLADSTEAEKERLGAPADAPLYRFGNLQKSFTATLESDEEVVAGSTDPVMIFHEWGTVRMPPRPAVGPALYKNREKIEKLLGAALVTAIIGGERADVTDYFGERAYHFGDDIS